MEDIEKYNKPGLRDAYNVMKHLENLKKEKERGGKQMDGEHDPQDNAEVDATPSTGQPVNPTEEAQEVVDEKTQEEKDLAEPEDEDDTGTEPM